MTVRTERIKREGSRPYVWEPGATAAAASIAMYPDTQFPDSKKYAPLDWIEVVNNEPSNDLSLTINGKETYKVPAKTIRTVDNCALRHVLITNDGAAITTARLIVVTVKKQPLTIDKWASRQ